MSKINNRKVGACLLALYDVLENGTDISEVIEDLLDAEELDMHDVAEMIDELEKSSMLLAITQKEQMMLEISVSSTIQIAMCDTDAEAIGVWDDVYSELGGNEVDFDDLKNLQDRV